MRESNSSCWQVRRHGGRMTHAHTSNSEMRSPEAYFARCGRIATCIRRSGPLRAFREARSCIPRLEDRRLAQETKVLTHAGSAPIAFDLKAHGLLFLIMACPLLWHRGYGATAARLTPDQKVGSSNLSALTFLRHVPWHRYYSNAAFAEFSHNQ